MTAQAQLVIAYDGATLKIEAAGSNGARRKVEGLSFADLPIEIQAELTDQLDRMREKQRADLMRVQGQNIQYVAETLRDTNLAVHVWGAQAESRVMRARLRYSSESAGNVDAGGRLKREKSDRKLPEPMEL